MISLHLTTPEHHTALAYQLDEKQSVFTTLPVDYFEHATETQRGITIMKNGEAVGFFVLDSGDNRLIYTDNRHSVLLRSMSINPLQQGKNIACNALATELLEPLVQRYFPSCNEIVLGVNHANHTAIALYRKSGFSDTGKTYMGMKGLQYIFHRLVTPLSALKDTNKK